MNFNMSISSMNSLCLEIYQGKTVRILMQMAGFTEINKNTKIYVRHISIINHLTYNHSLQHFQFEDLFEKALHLYKKIPGRLKHGLNLTSTTTFQFSVFSSSFFSFDFFPFFFSLCLLLSTRSYSVIFVQY